MAKDARLSIADWLTLLEASVDRPDLRSPLGEPLPGFPSEELQLGTTGVAGSAALKQAAAFYADIIDTAKRQRLQLDRDAHVMDFGSGWGRITRFFMCDVPLDNIVGIDVDADFVELSNRLFGGRHFRVCDPLPPTQFDDRTLDLVSAYSVLSHLSEAAARGWVDEFARILKPGGLFAFTTRDESFLDVCMALTQSDELNGHQRVLAALFDDWDAARRRYRAGEFVHRGIGGGGVRDSSFYGESFIPLDYVKREYAGDFEVVFASNVSNQGRARRQLRKFEAHYDQTCFVLRRR